MIKYIYKSVKFLQKFRIGIFLILLLVNFFFYLCAFPHQNILQAFYDAAALFALDVRIDPENIIYGWQNIIYVLGLLSGTYTILSIIEIFTKEKMKEELKNEIIDGGDHIVVVGLGDSNRVYIDSEIASGVHNIIVLEQNKNNNYLEAYEEHVGVVIGDARDEHILKSLDLLSAKHIVISTGSDMSNLEIAVQVLALRPDMKLFIHLEDRNLRYFHKENGVLSGANIKVYSYHEEAARELFSTYDIDGVHREIILSDNPYAIAVIGDTPLAYEVIAQACIMGQLPNGNKLTIYCMSENANIFKDNVELHFPEIQEVPNVILKYVTLDTGLKSFYKDDVWKNVMTNIIICFEDDQKNLDIASNLSNLTFLSDIVDKKMKTNFLIAMFSGYKLSEAIRHNHDIFQYLHAFGRIIDINNKKYVIAGERDKQAISTDFIYNNIGPKLIDYENYTYAYYAYSDEDYAQEQFLLTDNRNWSALSYFKKESNRAVSDQMKMKLKYLGLEIKDSDDDAEQLFPKNKKIFDKHIQDTRLQLARMEHNRWNAFHYLNGFKTIPFVSKEVKKEMKDIHEAKKVHMCLVDFDAFKNSSDELLSLGYGEGEFEGYDFMINEHIPLILANAGYEIGEM